MNQSISLASPRVVFKWVGFLPIFTLAHQPAVSYLIRPSSLQVTNIPSKRSGNVWAMISEMENLDIEDFGDGCLKILKSVVLSVEPHVTVTIALSGPNPQLRFTNKHHSFTMTGWDYVKMTGSYFGARGFQRVRLEEKDGEFQLIKYSCKYSNSGIPEIHPIESFILNEVAVSRFRAEQGPIGNHIVTLMASEEVILCMLYCIVDVYRVEYGRLNSTSPITEHFNELSRIVDMFVPATNILKTFLTRLHTEKLVSKFNHYELLSITLSQKDFIFDCLQV